MKFKTWLLILYTVLMLLIGGIHWVGPPAPAYGQIQPQTWECECLGGEGCYCRIWIISFKGKPNMV